MATKAYERFSSYFNSMGQERLDGLDRTYFEGMTNTEKETSYHYLLTKFKEGSDEAVDGLQALVGPKIYDVFSDRILELRKMGLITEQRLSLSISLWQLSGDVQYQDDMMDMLAHENEFVRAGALSALEGTPNSSKLIKRLEKICFDDSVGLVVKAAAQQLLKRYGLSLSDQDKADQYRTIYRQLKSENIDEKKLGLSNLKKMKKPIGE